MLAKYMYVTVCVTVRATSATNKPHHKQLRQDMASNKCFFATLNLYCLQGVQKKGATLFSTRTLAFLDRFIIIFVPVETAMHTPQCHVIYLLKDQMQRFFKC